MHDGGSYAAEAWRSDPGSTPGHRLAESLTPNEGRTMGAKPKAPPVGFPPDTVMDIHQLAGALGVNEKTAQRAELPCVYLTDRTPRWVWGDVIAELRRRTQARVA
jgi:hypothetical protein